LLSRAGCVDDCHLVLCIDVTHTHTIRSNHTSEGKGVGRALPTG
jgi:hypothetical protein